jgi:hypothetical protein
MRYQVPPQYFFRIHHVRPRFKSDVENVLVYMADSIVGIGEAESDDFKTELNKLIKAYPGNSNQTDKTINNWRTEISSLFGFFQTHEGKTRPGTRAAELSKSGDLVEFFKEFLYFFQYPGAHIKTKSVLEQIQHGIHFKPAQYILEIFKEAEERKIQHFRLSKAEVCHCVFNDLRVTAGIETPSQTLDRILDNKKACVTYDESGDVIRYAGDVLDYMYDANLLNNYNGSFTLNSSEGLAISKFLFQNVWFDRYDKMIARKTGSEKEISSLSEEWFDYVNKPLPQDFFATDLASLIENADYGNQNGIKAAENNDAKISYEDFIKKFIESPDNVSTKSIGDIGESVVVDHEKKKLLQKGFGDLVHLVQKIPNKFGVGYDVQSFETDGTRNKKYIEVKTTISANPLKVDRVHMTSNEWNTAETMTRSYYIYRIQITKASIILFVVGDPVGLYKTNKITMTPKDDGADIQFKSNKIGYFEDVSV